MMPAPRTSRRPPGTVDPRPAELGLKVNHDPMPPGGVQLWRDRTAGQIPAGHASESSPFYVLNGCPAWARTLLVGLASASPEGCTADFHATGKQVGYDRRWTAARGQIAAIDCTAQPGFTIGITRTSAGGVWPVVVAYSAPVDERWWREVSWYEEVVSGVQAIPSGAVKVLTRVPIPTWSWIARDRAGAAVGFPAPLSPATEYELPTDEFDPGAAGELIWRIRL